MKCERGDVALVDFPNSDLQTFKRRPVLVVSFGDLQTGLDQILVAMITSHNANWEHPSRVPLLLDSAAGRQSGIRLDSLIMTDNVATILTAAVVRKLGHLADMSAVDAALRHTLCL